MLSPTYFHASTDNPVGRVEVITQLQAHNAVVSRTADKVNYISKWTNGDSGRIERYRKRRNKDSEVRVPSMVSKYRQLSPSELLTRQWDDFHLRRRLSEMKAVNCSHLNGDGHGKAAGDAMVDAAKYRRSKLSSQMYNESGGYEVQWSWTEAEDGAAWLSLFNSARSSKLSPHKRKNMVSTQLPTHIKQARERYQRCNKNRAEIIDVPLQICHPWDVAQSKMEDPGEGGHILRIHEAEQPEWNTRHHDALKRREQSLQSGLAASKSIKPMRPERPHSAPTKRSQKGVPRNGKSTHSGLAQHSIGTREVLAAALGHSQIGHNLSGENKPLNAILHAKWF